MTVESRQFDETSVHMCVRCVNGTLEEDEMDTLEQTQHLVGTNGIIFLLTQMGKSQDYTVRSYQTPF